MQSVVTGGHGFIGKHLVAKLQKLGHEVVILPREFEEVPEFDYLFHLAAYGNRFDQQEEDETIKTNILLLQKLLTLTKHIFYKAFINFSSSSTLLDYETYYSATKGGGERLVKAFASKYDKPVVSIRPSSVYGKGDYTKHFIPIAIKAFENNQTLKVSSGDHDWIYIDDLITGVLKIAEEAQKVKGQAVNVSRGVNYSNYGVISILQDIFQKAGFVERIGQIRPYDTREWLVDNAALKALGWRSQFDLEAGLRRIIYAK